MLTRIHGNMGKCSISGCDKITDVRGYCTMHYTRLLRGSKMDSAPRQTSCIQCAKVLTGKQSKYCSRQCTVRYLRGTPERRKCSTCGDTFDTWDHGIYCSKVCKREGVYAREHSRRAKRRNSSSEKFFRKEIFERDNWRCQLCGKKTRRDVGGRHPLAPSLDHIVPISRGGSHTRINTQCAHLQCNFQKHSRILGQMRLFA